MNYTFSKNIGDCVYSVDMLFVRGYLKVSTVSANAFCSSRFDSHKSFKGKSQYSWFQDMYVLNGVSLYVGLFDTFDVVTRQWSVIAMAEIRYNPNKYPSSEYLDWFLENTDSRYLRKFDIAIDVPCEPKYILVRSSRTMSYINNGECRYYGAFGSDKHVKVYDKQKELADNKVERLDHPLTRIELSMLSNSLDSLPKDEFYRLDSLGSDFDQVDGLNDTDLAIINMFLALKVYEPNRTLEELHLGRGKEKKIRDALLSSSPSVLLGFSREIITHLLGLVSARLDCSTKAINKQLLTEGKDELPISPFN